VNRGPESVNGLASRWLVKLLSGAGPPNPFFRLELPILTVGIRQAANKLKEERITRSCLASVVQSEGYSY